eukprot:TRINITY_DN5_c0_g1_i1.p1 TRINITY_DN5_c0_g1~~TRINITY_DN5_c0_g1_i1.p1  ORF type:complete len:604 (-),score=133.07 TRINITY_DN5_c0_g1_i1:228-2012(-)
MSNQTNEASKIAAIKDMTLGAVKETLGTMTGNPKLELQGKAQKVHGKNEYEFAKAINSGETEPEKFKQAYHGQESTSAEGHVEGENASAISGAKDQLVGGIKATVGSATGNQNMELLGKAQSVHGRNETEFSKAQKQGNDEPEHFVHGTKTTDIAEGSVEGDKVSSVSALADRTIGSVKEAIGSATGNQNLELVGKAQAVHGRNESEYAKAERKGLDEPEHFVQGTKTTEHAQGTVEGDSVSSLHALKDRVVGTMKETIGTVTGNQQTELLGKAQAVHGRNESEFAKAERKGLDEPEHFVQGTKTTDHAEGTVEGDKSSSISALADRAIGSVKETIGSATGNQNLELVGKAQAVHGRNESEYAKAERKGLDEPEHFVQGTKTTEHAEGTVEGNKTSSISAIADRAVGSVKESIGSATGNQKLELVGKAQAVHGRNESEFAKAEKQGLDEPEHFVQGTKTTDHAEGTVEGQKASQVSGLVDRAVGSIKETAGSVTGNQNLELVGKAQAVHGRNESEFAKAEKQGLSEPQNFVQTVPPAQGSVEESKPSTLSGFANSTIGSVKETIGSATGNQKTEIEGLAQKIHGHNEANLAKAE